METHETVFHKRPMVGVAAGAVLGVLSGALLHNVWIAVGFAIACFLLAFLLRRHMGWMLLCAFFGLLLLRTAAVPLDSVVSGMYTVVGTVGETPQKGKRQTTVVLANVTLDGKPLSQRLSLKLPLSDLRYGDTISVSASVKPADSFWPVAYTGIGAEGKSSEMPAILSTKQDAYGLLLSLRESFSDALDRLYGDQAPIAKGMLLGDRSEWSYQTEQQFVRSGILHIFAVSGMHMTVLVTLFGTLLRFQKRWKNLLGIVLIAALYCALTSFTPSVLRAAFFLFGLQIARINERQADAPSAYCFSMAATLALRPYALYTASFLLSFGAMAGLILFTNPIRSVFRILPSRIASLLVGSVCAVIGVLPVQAYFFEELTWMSIPMSLVLGVLLPVMMPLAFLSMFLSPFSMLLAKIFAAVPYGMLLFIDRLTAWLPASAAAVKAPHLFSVLFYYVGLLLCSQMFLPNRRNLPTLGICSLVLSLLLWIVL